MSQGAINGPRVGNAAPRATSGVLARQLFPLCRVLMAPGDSAKEGQFCLAPGHARTLIMTRRSFFVPPFPLLGVRGTTAGSAPWARWELEEWAHERCSARESASSG